MIDVPERRLIPIFPGNAGLNRRPPWATMTILHLPPSCPRRRASSTPRPLGSITSASEYWIVRRSLSSGAHSRDPVADDDERRRSRDDIRPSFANSSAPKRAQGRPGARCTRGLMCKADSENAHEHTGSAEAVRPSLRNGFNGLFRALPGETRACLSPSPARSVSALRT
jgi:hypothetical protein